jgi:hypothetical protein
MSCPEQFSVSNINNIDKDFSIVTTLKKTNTSFQKGVFVLLSLVTKTTLLVNATDITYTNPLSKIYVLQFSAS